MGYLENLKNERFNNIYLVGQEKVKKEFFVHDALLPKAMTDSVRGDFLAHANIKVPAQEKQAFEDLIAQNHEVFNTDKNDLGCANHFEHKIETFLGHFCGSNSRMVKKWTNQTQQVKIKQTIVHCSLNSLKSNQK